MTDELKVLYDQLEDLEPQRRAIESIHNAIEYIKATCDHKDAKYVSKYFLGAEVWHCNDCDTRFTKEATNVNKD